jgi:hypothetical protein
MSAVIAGLAIGVVTTGLSFAQASKQRKLQERAEEAADEAMEAARGKLEMNFAEQMSVKKEGYELEREANLSAGAQAMEMGAESDRGGAATAGRVLAAQQAGQAQTRVAMGDEMTNIEAAIAEEDSRLRDLDVALDLEEVAGNQQKAADAQRAAQAAKQAGVQGAVNVAGQAVAAAVPLFKKNTAAQKAAVGGMSMDQAGFDSFGNVMGKKGGVSKSMGAAGEGGFTNLDLGSVANMSNKQFRQFKRELSPNQTKMLFGNQQYTDNYRNYMDQNQGRGGINFFDYLPD